LPDPVTHDMPISVGGSGYPRHMDSRAAAILDFWFADTVAAPQHIADRLAFWFTSDPNETEVESSDSRIARRFGTEVELASRHELDGWACEPSGRLALVIVLDQFRRSIYRGRPEAFAADAHTRELTLAGLAAGCDRTLEPIERVFLLMPLQHAEDLQVQERSVREYERLLASIPAAQQSLFSSFLEHAAMHRDIVRRFGRFPHRNAMLGRTSTPAERDYLASDAPTFGQG
jgi:uncharacterized protein (DUF924 family)